MTLKLANGVNPSYWIAKIEANRNRDRRNDQLLRDEGWAILRFWETDIRSNPETVADIVEELIVQRRRGKHAIH